MEESNSLQDLLAGLDSCESFLEDRETFPVANQPYKVQIAQLETKLRLYADQLKAKNRELVQTKAKKGGPEEEKGQLRSLAVLRAEVEQLRRELDQAKRAKAMLEGKYREALSRLARVSSEGLQEEPCSRLVLQVDDIQQANSALHTQVATLAQAIDTAAKKRDLLRHTVVPGLQAKVETAREELETLQRELDSLRPAFASQGTCVVIDDFEGNRDSSPRSDRVDCQTSVSPTSYSPRPLSPNRCRSSVPGSQAGDFPSMLSSRRGGKSSKVITSRPAGLRKQGTGRSNVQSPNRKSGRCAESFPEKN